MLLIYVITQAKLHITESRMHRPWGAWCSWWSGLLLNPNEGNSSWSGMVSWAGRSTWPWVLVTRRGHIFSLKRVLSLRALVCFLVPVPVLVAVCVWASSVEVNTLACRPRLLEWLEQAAVLCCAVPCWPANPSTHGIEFLISSQQLRPGQESPIGSVTVPRQD